MNLQLAIDRALLGGQQSNRSFPSNLAVKIKPFPWPSKQEDIGAASAAALLNLLLVYAFMAPTRAVVGSIVREKELRLREGMRILGLSVSVPGSIFPGGMHSRQECPSQGTHFSLLLQPGPAGDNRACGAAS